MATPTITKLDRLHELETALAAKENELEAIHDRIDALHGTRCESVSTAMKLVRDKDVIYKVRVEQVGNYVTQLNAASVRETWECTALEKLNKQLNALTKNMTEEQARIGEDLDSIKMLTGGFASVNNAERKVFLEQLKLKVKVMTKELKVAEVLKRKKNKAIKELRDAVSKKRSVQEKTYALMNDIRVTQRNTRERKQKLLELMAEHGKFDVEMNRLQDAKNNSCRAILDKDNVDLLREMDGLVEQRRTQDRVIKIQEYRVRQLGDRLATVRVCLEHQGIAKEVDERICEALQLLGKQPATVPNDDELRDPDMILPPSEKIHAAIYSLFVQERDSREKYLRTQNVVMREKAETIDAIVCKISDITGDLEREQDHLYEVSEEKDADLEKRKETAKSDFDKKKSEYVQLVQENLDCTKKIRVQKEKKRSESEE